MERGKNYRRHQELKKLDFTDHHFYNFRNGGFLLPEIKTNCKFNSQFVSFFIINSINKNMTAEEKLQKYREFILMMLDYLNEGSLKIETCRVLFTIGFNELLKDAIVAQNEGIEIPDINISIKLLKKPRCEKCTYPKRLKYRGVELDKDVCLICRNKK